MTISTSPSLRYNFSTERGHVPREVEESVLRFAFKVMLKCRVHRVRDSNDGWAKIFICERDDLTMNVR